MDGHARLRRVFPDVDVETVRAATGFELRVAKDLRPVDPPSASEIAAVRSIDPLGVRRSEFAPEELRRSFTHGSRASCAC
jgi:glutaconate CoA-transferase, subunit B